MVFIKLAVWEKHIWKHSKYGIQAYGLAEAESAKAETKKKPFLRGVKFFLGLYKLSCL